MQAPEQRYAAHQIEAELDRTVVFLTGPKRVGKATLGLSLPQAANGHLDWGAPEDRGRILRRRFHLDWTCVSHEAHRFENLVACHLIKWIHFHQDVRGLDLDLKYYRDAEGREVDFLVTDGGSPVIAVDCDPSGNTRSLRFWKRRYPDCAAWQLSTSAHNDLKTPDGIRVCHALEFLKGLE